MRNNPRGGDYAQAISPGDGARSADDAVNEIGGHWEGVALHRFMRTPGRLRPRYGVLRQGSERGKSAAIKDVMIALQDLSLAAAPGEPH